MVMRKIRPIFEICIWNFAVYVLFYLMNPNPMSFFEMNPNPLILGIMGFSLFYGNTYGLINAMVSIALYSWLYGMGRDNWQTMLFTVDYFKYPLLFLWFATSIGMVVDTHNRRRLALENTNDALDREYDKLKRAYQLSRKALTELQEQIIDSDTSIISLYDIAKRLKEIDEDEILTESVGVFSKYLKAKQVMVYHYQEDSAFLRFQIGVGIPHNFTQYSLDLKKADSAEMEAYKTIITEKRVMRFSEVLVEGFPMLAGPVIDNGKVIGIVAIREMDFSQVSNYAYTLFRIILDWVNDSLEHAKLFSGNQVSLIEGTTLITFDRFSQKVESERRREREYQMKHYLFAVESIEDPYEEAMRIQKVIRTRDSVSVLGEKIYLLLPATNVELHPTVKDKIFSRLSWNPRLTEIDEVLL